MNKKERAELQKKIISVEETIKVLKLQESNLLEAMQHHSYEHHEKEMNTWVREIIIGCDYIVRLEHSVKMMEELLNTRRKRGGKKKD